MKTDPRWITGGIAAAALVAVVGGTALAQNTPSPTPDAQTNTATTDGASEADGAEENDAPDFVGSITAPEDESLTDAQEAAALANLPGLISEADAITAATADGGTADTATLDNEDGSVVYEIDVTKADGTLEEVAVDAGNGDILEREIED